MENYIKMLIEMLDEAKERRPQPIDTALLEQQDWFQHMQQEESEMFNPSRTMEQIFGIDRMYFPPETKLTNEQVTILYNAICDLWTTYNYAADFRVTTPVRQRYEKMLNEWKKGYPLLKGSNATWHIELYHEEGDDDMDFEVESTSER